MLGILLEFLVIILVGSRFLLSMLFLVPKAVFQQLNKTDLTVFVDNDVHIEPTLQPITGTF